MTLTDGGHAYFLQNFSLRPSKWYILQLDFLEALLKIIWDLLIGLTSTAVNTPSFAKGYFLRHILYSFG